ncbi:hypothetical protein DFJ63DRAFT_314166 [Scheffersomyces coipomensis]|uniref:uncharacterized protein n=1 Tax=Scheffersomyces coipomensis TaxID=1788519 RepID=UPI00315D18BF
MDMSMDLPLYHRQPGSREIEPYRAARMNYAKKTDDDMPTQKNKSDDWCGYICCLTFGCCKTYPSLNKYCKEDPATVSCIIVWSVLVLCTLISTLTNFRPFVFTAAAKVAMGLAVIIGSVNSYKICKCCLFDYLIYILHREKVPCLCPIRTNIVTFYMLLLFLGGYSGIIILEQGSTATTSTSATNSTSTITPS